MSDRYPPGVPCWVECTDLGFYCELLGWTLQGGVAQLDGRALAGVGTRPEWLTYVRGDGDVAARVEQAGGSVLGESLFADPAGAAFGVEPERGAEVVNAPGCWNWSNLQTPDPEAAAAFYAAVFGWETSDVFSDAVAWIVAADGPARWDVTFNVEDADAIAHRAEELRGSIAVAPYDEGPTRIAALRDPNGAPFTVSSFGG